MVVTLNTLMTMRVPLFQRLKRFLRSPFVILVEIGVITTAGLIGAIFPQASTGGGAALARLQEMMPRVVAAGQTAGLDRIFHSGWFIGVVVVTACSLLVVVYDQVRRVRQMWTAKGISSVGVPVLHVGLLFVILAGLIRVLFSSEAVVDLMEGESLAPTDSAWTVQRQGMLAGPIRMARAIGMGTIESSHYRSGDLRELSVQLDCVKPDGIGTNGVRIPVNGSVELSGTRLFVGSDYGPAALVEWHQPTGSVEKTAALLKSERGGRFEAAVGGGQDERAYFRVELGSDGKRPRVMEVRVMKSDALMFTGEARVGETLALPGGGSLTLRTLRYWVRLHASRDPSVGFMYLGLALVVGGLALLFAFAVRAPRGRGLSTASVMTMILLCLTSLTGMTGCGGVSPSEARRLVERYNTVVAEAYRRGDVKLVDGVVGFEEGRKLTGLIGVRLDMGITLDSRMLSLDVMKVSHVGGELQVQTRERWRYCDRRIGTGQVVGEESEDDYTMMYHFMRCDGNWMVKCIEFSAPPKIGRRQALWSVSHGIMPTMTPVQQMDKKEGGKP